MTKNMHIHHQFMSKHYNKYLHHNCKQRTNWGLTLTHFAFCEVNFN